MYIVLYGECKAIIQNKEFLSSRRAMRDKIKKLYEIVDKSIKVEKKFEGMEERDPDFLSVLE